MNQDNRSLSPAAKIAAFLKDARKNRIWRYVTNVLAVLVVFVTTYMLVLPGITLTNTSGVAVSGTAGLEITSVDYENAKYNGTAYTANLTVTFSATVDDIKEGNYCASYYLPETVEPPANYVAGTVLQDEDGHFDYYYQQDSEGNWYIYLMLNQTYIDSLGSGTSVTGYFSFYSTISSSAMNESDEFEIKFSDSVTLTIPLTDVETAENMTATTDINVEKSGSSYNAEGNYIDYTITVYTSMGTGADITLTDVLSNLSSLSVKNIEVQSVNYYLLDASGNAAGDATAVSDYTFTYTSGDSEFSMTLPELAGSNTSNTTAANGSEYVVAYRVYLNDITGNAYVYTSNKVTATADSIYDVYTAYVTVSHSILSKSNGSLSSDGSTITWTITVNAGGQDISGYVLTDDMFDDAVSDVTISSSNNDTNYTIEKDSSGYVTSITFNDADGSENTATYTITYTTSVDQTLSGAVTYKNTATMTDPSGGESSASGQTWVNAHGGVDKEYSGSDYDSSTSTYTVDWTYSVSVPSTGISAGTVIYDYIGGADNYTSSSTTQYFTFDQVISFLLDQHTDQNNYQYSYTLPITITTTDSSWLESISSGYTISFYDVSNSKWITASELTQASYQNSSSYSSLKFTAFKIEFTSDVSGLQGTGVITLNYSTTLDASTVASGAVESLTTTNGALVQTNTGSLSDDASYTVYAAVTKTDGYGKSGTTYYTTSDGVLTWKARITVPSDATTSGSDYVVVDTLPSGVTLSSLYLYSSANSSYAFTSSGENSYSLTISNASGESCAVTATVSTDSDGIQTVTVNVPASYYAYYAGSTFWITYVCASSSSSTVTEKVTYTNKVVVTFDGTEYGSSEQTQVVTHTKSNMSKSASYDSDNAILDYSLVINPDAEVLLDGSSTLTLQDQLSAYMNDSDGSYAALQQSSVKFYYLYVLTDNGDGTYTYTDANNVSYTVSSSDGNIYEYNDTEYYKEETDDIGWTFASTNSYGTNYYTITAEVPDSTALLLQYSYHVYAIKGGTTPTTATGYAWVNLTNTASLEGGTAGSTSQTSSVDYYDSGFAAGLTGLTVYKVDSENYSTTLPGAQFDVYRYNGSAWEKITTLTATDGTITVNKSEIGTENFAYNTAYYLVESAAPSGYILDDTTKVYFYWSSSSVSDSYYPDGFTSGMSDGEVYDLTYFTQDIYFANTMIPETSKTFVTVEKEWVDMDGSELEDSEVDATEIEVTLYQYEADDVADTEDDSSTSVETVDIYVYYNGNCYDQIAITKGEAVTLLLDTGSDDVTISQWALYNSGDWYNCIDANWSVGGLRTCEISISADKTVNDLMINIAATSWGSGLVSVKSVSTTISGVNSSGLPHNLSGEYAGTALETYSIMPDRDGNWSLTVNNLDYEYYDASGVKHTYYYYFVETAVDGYCTTYSSSTGNTESDTLTITNTKIPTTSIEVEKSWTDSNGTELDSDDSLIPTSISVDLYRTEVVTDSSSDTSTQTATVKVTQGSGNSDTSVYDSEESVLIGTEVIVNLGTSSDLNGQIEINGTITDYWHTFSGGEYKFTLEGDTTIRLYIYDSSITPSFTYEGRGSSSGSSGTEVTSTSYTESDLPNDADSTLVKTYTIKPDDNGDWSLSISNIPSGYVDDNGVFYSYYYYVKESAVTGFETTYSIADAISTGTITITNTKVSGTYTYTSATVKKVWANSDTNSSEDISTYVKSATFALYQVTGTDTSTATKVGEITLDGVLDDDETTAWSYTWSNLLASFTKSGESTAATYSYYLVETSAVVTDDVTLTTTAYQSGGTEFTGTELMSAVTAYQFDLTSTSPSITVTNTITVNNPEETTVSIQVEKAWSYVGCTDGDVSGKSVTLGLYRLSNADNGELEAVGTVTLDGTTDAYETTSWSYIWSDLLYTSTSNSATTTYTYYIGEVASTVTDGEVVKIAWTENVDTSSSSSKTYSDGSNTVTVYPVSGLASSATAKITLTNTVSANKSIAVVKKWTNHEGDEITQASATAAFTLLQLLKSGDAYVTDDNSKVIVNTQTLTLDSSNWSGSWTDLPTAVYYNGVVYECVYYVVESGVTNNGASIDLSKYTITYVDADNASISTTYSYNGTDYYLVANGSSFTVTNKSTEESIILPMTGGPGNKGMTALLGSSIVLLALSMLIARKRKEGGDQLG